MSDGNSMRTSLVSYSSSEFQVCSSGVISAQDTSHSCSSSGTGGVPSASGTGVVE